MRAGYVLTLLLATISCIIAVAACGSSSTPRTTASSSPLGASLRFAACMRAHGVPNFGDQTVNGTAATPAPGTRVNKRSPAFQGAQRACATLQAAMVEAKPKKSRATQLRYAKCMRAHGVPSFPDPLPGGGFNVPSTVNAQSPAFIAANTACGGGKS